MTIGTRDHLAQFDARVFPRVCFVAITKVIGRACAVEHDELAEVVFTFQHVTECGAQRCDACAHRNEHEIAEFNRKADELERKLEEAK